MFGGFAGEPVEPHQATEFRTQHAIISSTNIRLARKNNKDDNNLANERRT